MSFDVGRRPETSYENSRNSNTKIPQDGSHASDIRRRIACEFKIRTTCVYWDSEHVKIRNFILLIHGPLRHEFRVCSLALESWPISAVTLRILNWCAGLYDSTMWILRQNTYFGDYCHFCLLWAKERHRCWLKHTAMGSKFSFEEAPQQSGLREIGRWSLAEGLSEWWTKPSWIHPVHWWGRSSNASRSHHCQRSDNHGLSTSHFWFLCTLPNWLLSSCASNAGIISWKTFQIRNYFVFRSSLVSHKVHIFLTR